MGPRMAVAGSPERVIKEALVEIKDHYKNMRTETGEDPNFNDFRIIDAQLTRLVDEYENAILYLGLSHTSFFV